MAGYSGTPLPKKLGLKPNLRVFLEMAPVDVRAELKASLAACDLSRQARAPLDFAMLFVRTQVELRAHLAPLARALAPAGMLWISWPKKSSGVASDLSEDEVRRQGLAAGLVDIKVCAVNDVWSGLKFVIPVANRKKA